MPRPFYIIDGYNLMHAAGLARERYGPGDLERCRNRLLGFLARRLTAAERRRTTIVFDAGAVPSELPRTYRVEEMEVRFARTGGDADTLIEELVAGHSAPKQVQVVSSDHRLQRAARRRRASFVESPDFYTRLDSRPARLPPEIDCLASAKSAGLPSPEDARQWMEIFGLADGAELVEPDVAHEPPRAAETSRPSPEPVPGKPPEPPPRRPTPAPSDVSDGSGDPAAYTEEELAFWRRRVETLADEGEPGLGR